jgi:hypothetical protein
MRRNQFVLVLGCLMFSTAAAMAEEVQIDQNASANYSFVAVTKPDTSNVRINQHGKTNAISSTQLAPDLNQLQTKQSGWTNTVTIYQDGFIDIATVTQSGPRNSEYSPNLPTAYDVVETDQGYLSTFTSGEVSIVTLTSPNMTFVSQFGRRH